MKRNQLQNFRKMIEEKGDYKNAERSFEQFLSSIEYGLTADILALKYRNGLDWNQIACHLNGELTADGVERIHEEFWMSVED